MPLRFSQRQVLILISIAIIAMTLIAYEPVRHNGFVNYDDDKYITANPDIQSPLTWELFKRAFTKPDSLTVNWHPLTTLSHILDYQFFELKPAGHHIVSVLLHVLNALLLFWLIVKMTNATWSSVFVAAVFALHPLQVESVAWAAERKTVLSGLFWLLTTAVYVWYARRPGAGRYITVFVVYGLCIMTKPVVVTLPLVLLLLDYWPLERFENASFSIRKAIVEKIPLMALSGLLSVITFVSQRGGGAVAGLELIPFNARIANIFFSYVKYIYKMICPSRLAVFYPHSLVSLTDAAAIGCLLLFVVITFFSLRIGRRRKYAATGWLWFVVTLIPVIGLVQTGSQAMADRYMYVPMLGLLFIVAWAVRDLIETHRHYKYIAAALSVAVPLILIILTRIQVGYWRNNMTLWEHTLKVTKNNTVAENNYANALCEQGRINEAESHYRDALRIQPQYSKAILGLAAVLVREKKFDEAVDCYKDYLKLKQDSATGYYNLAFALGMQKKYDEALESLTKALKIDANLPEIHKRMGDLLFRTGKLDEAVEHFKEALKTDTGNAAVYSDLGSAYYLQGKYDLAIESWTKALELAQAAGQKELARKIESQLESYKKGQ